MEVGAQISLVIPMFNEARAIPATIEQLTSRFHSDDVEIFFVDDGSTDDSAGLVEHLTKDQGNFEVIRLPKNSGKGAAVRAGVARTSSSVVIFMDADLSTSLNDLGPLLEQLTTHDIAIGSRSVPGAVVNRSNMLRQIMGRSFNRLMRIVTGLPVHDSQCGFKAFRGDVARLLFSLSRTNHFAFDPESALHSITQSLKFQLRGSQATIPQCVPSAIHSALRSISFRFASEPAQGGFAT